MTKTNALSRRKLLGRIGLLAAAGYTVPALTTLSVAHAGSGASNSSGTSAASAGVSVSSASTSSGPSSSTSPPPTTTSTSPTVVEATCGAKDMNDPVYLQCLVDNRF